MGVYLSSLESVLEETFREIALDLMEDAELPGAVCALRFDIGGAAASTSQLHCPLLAIIQTSVNGCILP